MEEYKIVVITTGNNHELIEKMQEETQNNWKFAAFIWNKKNYYEILFKRTIK